MAQYVRTNYTNYDNTVCYNNLHRKQEHNLPVGCLELPDLGLLLVFSKLNYAVRITTLTIIPN